MRYIIMSALLAMFIPSFAFAADADSASSPDCETIAKACVDAGFTERDGKEKAFWQDCMKPILFNKEVSGVTVDAKVVKACRKFKIKNMQDQINELKKVK